MINKKIYAKLMLICLLIPVVNFGQEQQPPELGIYEKLDQVIPDDIILTNMDYEQVNLKESINKPTVLTLVYYECPGICSPLLEGVAEVIDRAEIKLGEDYDVYTISFDHSETPKLARDKKKNYAKLVSGQNVDDGWTWFTADSTDIDRLLRSVGFRIKQEGEEFIHPASLIVLSPEGKITRYLHGTYFLPFDLKMAVVEASQGKSGPTINKVLKYCFSYDPEGKKYVFNFTKVSGTIVILAALALFLGLIIKRKSKTTTEENQTNQ